MDKYELQKAYIYARALKLTAYEALNSPDAKGDELNERMGAYEMALANFEAVKLLKELYESDCNPDMSAFALDEDEKGSVVVYPYRDMDDERALNHDRFEIKKNGKLFCKMVVSYDYATNFLMKLTKMGYVDVPYNEIESE